jgi:hypothetical protein
MEMHSFHPQLAFTHTYLCEKCDLLYVTHFDS